MLVAGVSTGLIGALVVMGNAAVDGTCELVLGSGGWQEVASGDGGFKKIAGSLASLSTNPAATPWTPPVPSAYAQRGAARPRPGALRAGGTRRRHRMFPALRGWTGRQIL
ncbi:hypothetical protein [Actinomadura harenae]|uniref:Uncharacterized protein n=1 Tax=Actinomadura harenae TaxID=2483351 RepID=A0A3M2LXK9_9ACTN|nr:hypothetical protein [Actinomadura harenae]RMI42067.1 hypothetical protein EBO15_20650 [Actinomadura harenae]